MPLIVKDIISKKIIINFLFSFLFLTKLTNTKAQKSLDLKTFDLTKKQLKTNCEKIQNLYLFKCGTIGKTVIFMVYIRSNILKTFLLNSISIILT